MVDWRTDAPPSRKRQGDASQGTSFSNSAVSVNDVFVAGKLVDAARASDVKLVGADSYFGAESKLSAVVEPRA